MLISLKRARLAFPNIWEPKAQDSGKGEPTCNGKFILDPKSQKVEVDKVVKAMQAVATERWGAKAGDVLKTLQARGDLCLHKGETKAEYDGFEGMVFVSAGNKAIPLIVAKAKYEGKVVRLEQNGSGYIGDKKIDGYKAKTPYSGCYVNVQVDIWAQDNQYGKRINAKLIAIQFEDDGKAFSGGEGFDEGAFEFDDGDGGGSGDGFGFDDSGSSSESGGDGFDFGGGEEAATEDDGFFN
jgi:hypothetical protein